jgi:hypothetical protein
MFEKLFPKAIDNQYYGMDIAKWVIVAMSPTRIFATMLSMPVRLAKAVIAAAIVQLRWDDPDPHQVTEINGNFYTWDWPRASSRPIPATS